MAQFTNTATLLFDGNLISSNTVTGEITQTLSLEKTALTSCYSKCGNVTYMITIRNTGAVPRSGLTVSDNLGAYTFNGETLYPLTYAAGSVRYLQNGVLQNPPQPASTAPLAFSGITVPANGTATLIYAAAISQYAPLDTESEIQNTATLSGEAITELTASEAIGTCSRPDLTITKFMSPSVLTESGQVTYTFIIQNHGNTAAVATDLIQISDQLTPALSNLTVTFNGTAWELTTDYTYQNGLFQSVPGQITVPAATYTQNQTTGAWNANPGVSALVIQGTV